MTIATQMLRRRLVDVVVIDMVVRLRMYFGILNTPRIYTVTRISRKM